jgi:membrane protein HdeD
MTDDVGATEALPPRRDWRWVLAMGIALVLAGLLALMNPFAAGLATGITLGWVLVVAGLVAAWAGLTHGARPARWLFMLLGLFSVLVGALVLLFPFAGALSLVWTFGAWLIAGGLAELAAAFRMGRARWWLILLGIVDLMLGIMLVIIVMEPLTALFLLAVAVGVSLLVRGAGAVMFALELRRTPPPSS